MISPGFSLLFFSFHCIRGQNRESVKSASQHSKLPDGRKRRLCLPESLDRRRKNKEDARGAAEAAKEREQSNERTNGRTDASSANE
jgi:hypothetical protein